MSTIESLPGPPSSQRQPRPILQARQTLPQWARRSRGRRYVMLSGALAVALALSVLFATSHRMINLDEQSMPHSLLAVGQDLHVVSGSHQDATSRIPLSGSQDPLSDTFIRWLMRSVMCRQTKSEGAREVLGLHGSRPGGCRGSGRRPGWKH